MVHLIRRQEDNGQERGAILVLTAFAMILLLGIAALVVDIVILQQARIRAQATADSSALAAVQDLDVVSNATAVAQEYALRNYNVAIGDWAGCTDPGALTESTGVDCISVNTASNLKFIRVRLPDREVSTFFAPLLGIDAFSVSATATAEVEYLSGPPGIPTTGDADPADFQEVANFLREGKLGSDTFDDCPNEPPANWLDVNPPNTYTDDQGKPAKWGEYIFVFENVNTGGYTTVCGTSSDAITDPDGNVWQWGMDTWVVGTGGATNPGPGMPMHVSCSLNFIEQDGWDGENKTKAPSTRVNGPNEILDPNWHIVLYIGARYQVSKGKGSEPPAGEIYIKNACGYSFEPLVNDPPSSTNIRLRD